MITNIQSLFTQTHLCTVSVMPVFVFHLNSCFPLKAIFSDINLVTEIITAYFKFGSLQVVTKIYKIGQHPYCFADKMN